MQTNAEFLEDLERGHFETALPPGRFFINYYRRREGKAPLRMRRGRAVAVGEA